MPRTPRTLATEDLKKYAEHIYSFLTKNSRMPSYAEICSICRIKSKNTAHNIVKKLKSLGLLTTDRVGKIIPTKVTKSITTQTSSNIRILGLVEAGFPTPAEESLHDNISLDDWIINKREASFMLKVKGDSMKDAGILDGDMIIVERTSQAKTNQIVVAEVDGAYTVKYLRKDKNDTYFLEPANKAFKNIYPTEELKINAVVKAVVRKY